MFENKPERVIEKCRGCSFIENKAFTCTMFDNPEAEWIGSPGCWGQLYGSTIYLGGSIDAHIEGYKPREWRSRATKELEAQGYKILNPFENESKYNSIKDIVEADLADIKKCNILLVEMTFPDMPYIGTSMEIREAHNNFKEIIVFGSANKSSKFLQYHATHWVPTLEAAIGLLRHRAHADKQSKEL
jgi:hypothetical protein